MPKDICYDKSVLFFFFFRKLLKFQIWKSWVDFKLKIKFIRNVNKKSFIIYFNSKNNVCLLIYSWNTQLNSIWSFNFHFFRKKPGYLFLNLVLNMYWAIVLLCNTFNWKIINKEIMYLKRIKSLRSISIEKPNSSIFFFATFKCSNFVTCLKYCYWEISIWIYEWIRLAMMIFSKI